MGTFSSFTSGGGFSNPKPTGNVNSPGTNDIVINDTTKGLVLKDNQGTPHYWRVTVSDAGALVITDIGTSLP